MRGKQEDHKAEKAEQKLALKGGDSLQKGEATAPSEDGGAEQDQPLDLKQLAEQLDDIEAPPGPTRRPEPQVEERQPHDRELFMMMSAITDSYKSIQGKLEQTVAMTPGYDRANQYFQVHNRRIERMCIFIMLIPAFVMSVLATYRLNNSAYHFDLSELEKKDMNLLANKNFDNWNNALLTRSSAAVTELYATDVSFLPTMSDDFAVSERSEDRYFIHFVEKQPAGIIIEDKVQPMGTDAYLHAGLYDFLIPDEKNGVMSRVRARFTFMWRKFCDETAKKTIIPGIGPDKKCHWRIVHHHSSKLPSTCIGAPDAGHGAAPATTPATTPAPTPTPAPVVAPAGPASATPAPASVATTNVTATPAPKGNATRTP